MYCSGHGEMTLPASRHDEIHDGDTIGTLARMARITLRVRVLEVRLSALLLASTATTTKVVLDGLKESVVRTLTEDKG